VTFTILFDDEHEKSGTKLASFMTRGAGGRVRRVVADATSLWVRCRR